MSRPAKKGPFAHEGLLERTEEMNASGDKKATKTRLRSSIVFPQMISHTIAVHDGRKHVPAFVSEDMVGYKPDELILARTYGGHGYDEKATRKRE